MLKVVTLLKRRADLSVEAFQNHWRDRHGPLAAQGVGLRRYVQSHALLQGYGKGDLLFDGIEEMWFDSLAGYDAFLRSSLQEALRRAEDEFLDVARKVTMPVDVIIAKGGLIPQNAVKSIEFVNRKPGMLLEPFRKYWRDAHGPLASKIAVIRRYEQNHLCVSEYDGDTDPVYDGLAITWFDSTADMRLGATTPQYNATRADEPNFLARGHLPIIITREIEILGSGLAMT